MNHLLDPLGADHHALTEVFSKISSGNSILFLGAGASVTDKKYLSKQIIDYYEDKIGKHLEIPNITEFLDVAAENDWFRRSEFDTYVHDLLMNYKVTDTQRTILSIPWREIITTNFDRLIEDCDHELKQQQKNSVDIVYVRSVSEYHRTLDNNQIKYIKLNGCMTDKSRYPFLFSSSDFSSAKKFYSAVLENLENLSDKITLLAAGYSFSDEFARDLLERFDTFNYRDSKWMWNIDPFVNEHKLPFFAKRKIAIIKCTVAEFFEQYRAWEHAEYGSKLKRSGGIIFTDSRKARINIGNKEAYNLKGLVVQLNENYSGLHISEEKFFKGEEPNYKVIENGFDVVRAKKLKEAVSEFERIGKNNDALTPIIFLTGNFGTGKTTFIYRLIHELTNDKNKDRTAFEILDIDRLSKENVRTLIEAIQSREMIFYCNNVEVDSVYKSILELRNFISTLQLSGVSISFLLSIRENMLELHKKSRLAKSTYELNVDSKMTRTEIGELLEKLRKNGFVDFRDSLEKTHLINKIEKKYSSDSFITLLNIVTDGKHINSLRDAYFQLSKPCQKAFVYTALVHKHNLLLPSTVLRNLVSPNWDEFRKNVINVEGRGILIQEDVPYSKGTEPDLYFRTKHPIIAHKLIREIHPNEDKRLSLYKEIIKSMTIGMRNSRFIVNLIKAIRASKEFNVSRIEQLFDLAYIVFAEDPHFLLQYSINLQKRGTKSDIENAIDKIKYAETLLDHRNDKFIHRKGSLYFKLAKIYYKEERSRLNLTFKYLNEARDWLILKQQLDPCSSFSYVDLLELLIWELDKISFSEEEEAKMRINIEDYFDLALNAVSDDKESILELREKYDSIFHSNKSNENLRTLLEMYEKSNLRPFACILLFNYYSSKGNKEKSTEIFDEIESYATEDVVAKFLFKYYGRNLFDPNIRMKFFRLSKKMDWYEEENPLRYNYYHYIAESYNMQLHAASMYLERITDKYQYLNPEYQRGWDDPDTGRPRIFEGVVGKSRKGFKVFKCAEFNHEILFTKSGAGSLSIGSACKANIYFFLNGKRAVLANDAK